MKFNTKQQLDNYIKSHTIPSQLELKESPLGGLGLFAKVDLPKGTKFPAIDLGSGYDSVPELKRYVWWCNGTIYGGVGYYCNGSCNYFGKLIDKGITKLGPYNLVNYNIELVGNRFFKTIRDINKGEELILNYGDGYFFMPTPFGLDYNSLIINGDRDWIDVSNKVKNNFSERLRNLMK